MKLLSFQSGKVISHISTHFVIKWTEVWARTKSVVLWRTKKCFKEKITSAVALSDLYRVSVIQYIYRRPYCFM